MKKLMIAIAMTIALPAAAFAQAAASSASAPAERAGHDMKAMSCKDMHASMSGGHSSHPKAGHSDHSKMDHSKMDHSKMACGDTAKAGAAQDPTNSHANHKQ